MINYDEFWAKPRGVRRGMINEQRDRMAAELFKTLVTQELRTPSAAVAVAYEAADKFWDEWKIRNDVV